MTDCTFTLAYDDDAGQVILEDLPAGPAGEAGLVPAHGVELMFDRADGRLSRVFADVGQGGPAAIGEPALAIVTGLFGTEAGDAIRQVQRHDGAPVPLPVDEGRLADLSRLARLDAARVTSPVAPSPWWAVEAAQIAARAGLSARAAAEGRQAVRAMAGLTAPVASVPEAAVLAAAELVETVQPELARRLRDRAVLPRGGRPAAASSGQAGWAALPPVAEDATQPGRDGGRLRWSLDPQVIPPGVFRYGWWPACDLRVRTGESGIVVEAELAPGAAQDVLAGCRVRLVDQVSRAVLGIAPLRGAGRSRVRAEIPGPVPPGEAWVEVVGDADRPVVSGQLRHIRRAMRWADAALAADRRPPGPGSAPWARLAGLAWERCAEDWSAAGDPDRAYLAAIRAATSGLDVTVPPPASGWAKELAGRPGRMEAPFLAEIAG